MDFVINEFVILAMRSRQIVNSVCMQLPDGQTLKSLKGGECYKYIGVLVSDRVITTEMKIMIKEWIRRVRNQ